MTDRAKAMDNLIAQDADLIDKLRDEDSYYRIQEKHWCIDAEELERQRLAAADLIETQAREIERLHRSAEYWKSICKIQTRETQSQQSKWTEALSRAALGDSHD